MALIFSHELTPLIPLNSHELTPFFSPSLLRKEGEGPKEQSIVPPLCGAERGQGVSSWGFNEGKWVSSWGSDLYLYYFIIFNYWQNK